MSLSALARPPWPVLPGQLRLHLPLWVESPVEPPPPLLWHRGVWRPVVTVHLPAAEVAG